MLPSLLTHAPIEAYFSKNHKDFTVKERAAYEFSGNGEWLILLARKKDLTTNDLLKDLAKALGIKSADIGYAGLKDREGYTEQYLCVHKSLAAKVRDFSHEKAKIEAINYHDNKLKIGHLIGNSFFIRLKKVTPLNAMKLEGAFRKIEQNGFVNYFGYQRFGRDGDNAKTAVQVLKNEKSFKRKLNKFLISALQSELFNNLIAARINLSRLAAGCKEKELAQLFSSITFGQIFAHLSEPQGEIFAQKLSEYLPSQQGFASFCKDFLLLADEQYLHFPKGKFFSENLTVAAERFDAKDITPAAQLLGGKFAYAPGLCGAITHAVYEPFRQLLAPCNTSARAAVSFLSELKTHYDEQKAHFCAEFFLQKGCYATTVLEQALAADFRE